MFTHGRAHLAEPALHLFECQAGGGFPWCGFELWLGFGLAVLVFGYLVFALLFPEKLS